MRMSEDTYLSALGAAFQEWKTLEAQERDIAFRKAKIKKTINALYPLVFPDEAPDINAFSLPNAIRLIFSTTDRKLSANDVRSKLEDLGFDVDKLGDNPTANIMTAIRRMVENDELSGQEGDSKQNKTFGPGPDLKPVPETTTSFNAETVEETLRSLGLSPPPAT